MLSKNQSKLIKSLNKKKHRLENGLFVAEGVKVIKEFLKSSFQLSALYSVADIFHTDEGESHIISPKELQNISFLKTAQTAVGVFKIPNHVTIDETLNFNVVLDGVRDPGNLGTIIRMCDWFGVGQLICSPDTVDCYNPKVVQATMGSLSRVKVIYTDLQDYLAHTSHHKYGAFMEGHNIYETKLEHKKTVLVLGNESSGIRTPVETLIQHKIAIPNYSTSHAAESLNVAMAGAILMSEFKRR
jgi:TrmH family RNA methyltransferase